MGKKMKGKREGLFTGARSKQGGVFPPVRCCEPGEQKVQHLYPQRKRSKGWLGFNGGDAMALGFC